MTGAHAQGGRSSQIDNWLDGHYVQFAPFGVCRWTRRRLRLRQAWLARCWRPAGSTQSTGGLRASRMGTGRMGDQSALDNMSPYEQRARRLSLKRLQDPPYQRAVPKKVRELAESTTGAFGRVAGRALDTPTSTCRSMSSRTSSRTPSTARCSSHSCRRFGQRGPSGRSVPADGRTLLSRLP